MCLKIVEKIHTLPTNYAVSAPFLSRNIGTLTGILQPHYTVKCYPLEADNFPIRSTGHPVW
jgi:hypothetical protein